MTTASERVVGMPQRMHRLADQILPQHRPDRGAPIRRSRERCQAGPFELHIPQHAGTIAQLAEQDRAPIAEARHEVAELMARHRPSQSASHRPAAGCRRRSAAASRSTASTSSPSSAASGRLNDDELWIGHGRRGDRAIEPLGQGGVRVLKTRVS